MNRALVAILLAGSASCLTAGAASDGSAAAPGFVATGAMAVPRYGHSATALHDGRVFVAGGDNDDRIALGSAELYDPASGTFGPTGDSVLPRLYHADHTVLLRDGRVLSMGGCADIGGSNGGFNVCQGVPDAELYDPLTGLSAPTGSMAGPRNLFTATVLQDGTVLVAGGGDSNPDNPQWVLPAEVYDPASGQFRSVGEIGTGRAYFTATLLDDGRVLVVGGFTTGATYLSSAELFDPATGSFSATGSMAHVRAGHTASRLPDGRVLIAGGFNRDETVAESEIYDPATGTFSPSRAVMATPRYYHSATTLADGRVLIVGGLAAAVQVAAAELYDPAGDRFSPAGALPVGVYFHTATPLQDGRVLIVGGLDAGFVTQAAATLYTPDDGDGIFHDGFDG